MWSALLALQSSVDLLLAYLLLVAFGELPSCSALHNRFPFAGFVLLFTIAWE
jgi:hypothetical protein